jgi:hypothetical protein
MKYLTHYIEEQQNKLFIETGSFFAFGKKQFEEQKQPGVDYANLGMGLICPVKNVEKFLERWDKVYSDGVKADMEENGAKNIIWRELFNHECQISYDCSDVTQKLSEYPITEKQIADEFPAFMDHCRDNDLF